jgi:DNA-binding transcriptional MerR regulator
MGTADRYSRGEVQRILDVTEKQLDYWERLRIVCPKKGRGERFYDFRDLIGLRTAKQLIGAGVPANRLRRSLDALREKLSQIQSPLAELRVVSDGRDIIVERDGARLEPLSGQFVLNFETRELDDKVHVMPERSADEWLAVARTYETDKCCVSIRAASKRSSIPARCTTNKAIWYQPRNALSKQSTCNRPRHWRNSISAVFSMSRAGWKTRVIICVRRFRSIRITPTRTTTWHLFAKN